jgi:hypothetical protein
MIEVGAFEYAGTHRETGTITFSYFDIAVAQALEKGGYLAKPEAATYKLSGSIKEVKMPYCSFGSCESGSAVEYTLTNKKTGKVAYTQLVVVPYTMECPVFMNDPTPFVMKAYAQTVGANIAQLIQILNRKTQSTLNN